MTKELYETFVKEGHCLTCDDVTAEMCKLVENTYRDINIAFANQLSEICAVAGIDVHELIALANRHPRVNILSPGTGRGRTLPCGRSMVPGGALSGRCFADP